MGARGSFPPSLAGVGRCPVDQRSTQGEARGPTPVTQGTEGPCRIGCVEEASADARWVSERVRGLNWRWKPFGPIVELTKS